MIPVELVHDADVVARVWLLALPAVGHVVVVGDVEYRVTGCRHLAAVDQGQPRVLVEVER